MGPPMEMFHGPPDSKGTEIEKWPKAGCFAYNSLVGAGDPRKGKVFYSPGTLQEMKDATADLWDDLFRPFGWIYGSVFGE